MDYGNIKDFIATLGFPIFVAVYLLTKLERKLELLWEENKRTNVVLTTLAQAMDVPPPLPTPLQDSEGE